MPPDLLIQYLSLFLGSSVLGVVLTRILDHLFKDRPARRLSLSQQVHDLEDENRVLDEALAIHRRLIIDAPCLGPASLPPHPLDK